MSVPGSREPAAGATLDASHVGGAPTEDPPAAVEAEALDLPLQTRDRYAGQAEHGRGGLGRVLRAQDRRLRRPVAIKEMLAPDGAASARARFVREALVTARLQHPGIVPVYDAGRWPDGAPFYAMKLVSGESLRDAIAARPELDQRLALLPRLLAAAQAVAYAHAEGVIHRDLKPGNVVLGPYGETVVIDWGLAKDMRAAEAAEVDERPADVYALSHFEMTRVGAIVGTPGYMAPEQAAGELVDARADVYALGAMLYHVLAGAPPYEPARGGAETPDRVLAAVRRGPPPPLAERAPGVPRDLVAIVGKAMARGKDERYPDASGLADDLQRFLAGQLVNAREYGWLTRLARFLGRRRLPLAAAAVLVIALGVTAVESFRRVVRARAAAEARGDELVLAQARAVMDRDPTAALAWLKRYPLSGRDQAGASAIAADASSRGVAKHVLVADGSMVVDAALSPDRATAATVDGYQLRLWDVASGALRREVPLPGVWRLAYAPDSQRIGAVGDLGDVWLIDAATGGVKRIGAHTRWSQEVAFDPRGRAFATADIAGNVRVWPVAGSAPRELTAHDGQVTAMVFTKDGELVTAGSDGRVRAWPEGAPARELHRGSAGIVTLAVDARDRLAWTDGTEVTLFDGSARVLGQHVSPVRHLAFTSNGHVVAGSDDGAVLEWLDSGAPRRLDGHRAPIAALAAGPAGAIVSADAEGEIRLWRGGDVTVLRGHSRTIRGLGVGADGLILSAGDDGSARLWFPPPARRAIPIGGTGDDGFGIAWSARSDAFVVGTRGGAVLRVDPSTGRIRRLGAHDLAAYDVEITPDGKTAVSGGWDDKLGIWPLDGGPGRLLDQGSKIWAVAVAPDGATVATGGGAGDIWIWDLASGLGRERHRHPVEARSVAFSPDGKLLASSAVDGSVQLTRVSGGNGITLPGMAGQTRELKFSPDGATLYAVGSDGTSRSWSTSGGPAQIVTEHGREARALALSPDGGILASGGTDSSIRLVKLSSGRETVLRGHEAEVRHLAFSPDGQWLASAGSDASVRLWSVTGSEVVVLRGHRGVVHRVAFSPDGVWLASTSADGTAGLWRVTGVGHVPRGGPAWQAWLALQTSASISAATPLVTPPTRSAR